MPVDGYLKAEAPSVDLEIAEVIASELEAYILSDDLYRTVIARTSAGDMTLNMSGGDFLARLGRLHGDRDALTDAEQRRLGEIQTSSDEVIHGLQTRFLERLNRELKARLSEYLHEVKEGDVIEVTSRGETIARILPTAGKRKSDPMDLVRDGIASWNGKRIPAQMPEFGFKDGTLASDLVLENRD